MALIVILTHLFYAIVHAFTIYYTLNVMSIPKNINVGPVFTGYAGWYKFMTFWNLIAQCTFFTLSLLCDVTVKRSNDPTKRNLLQKFLDYFYAVIVFPLATLVFIVFWGLYAVDRELIFPTSLDPHFPVFMNHLMHTVILPFVLVEMMIVKHHYPSKSSAITGATVFNLVYGAWTLVVFFVGKVWTYPILAELSWPGRAGFAAGNLVLFCVLYFIGETLNNIMWGKKHSGKSSKKGKSN